MTNYKIIPVCLIFLWLSLLAATMMRNNFFNASMAEQLDRPQSFWAWAIEIKSEKTMPPASGLFTPPCDLPGDCNCKMNNGPATKAIFELFKLKHAYRI